MVTEKRTKIDTPTPSNSSLTTVTGDTQINIDFRLQKSEAKRLNAKFIEIVVTTADISRTFDDLRFQITVIFQNIIELTSNIPIQQTIYSFPDQNISSYLLFKYRVLNSQDFTIQLESCIGNTEFAVFKSTNDIKDQKPYV